MPHGEFHVAVNDFAADPMRNAVRFPLHCKVMVETEAGVLEAETEDISSSGVLFRMKVAPEINSRLSWTMVLTAAVRGGTADIVVRCTGRVVWNAPRKGFRQVGAVIDSYRMMEASH